MTENKIIEQIRQLLRIASDRGASVNERELAQRRAERLRRASPGPARPSTASALPSCPLLIGAALVLGGHIIDRRLTK